MFRVLLKRPLQCTCFNGSDPPLTSSLIFFLSTNLRSKYDLPDNSSAEYFLSIPKSSSPFFFFLSYCSLEAGPQGYTLCRNLILKHSLSLSFWLYIYFFEFLHGCRCVLCPTINYLFTISLFNNSQYMHFHFISKYHV